MIEYEAHIDTYTVYDQYTSSSVVLSEIDERIVCGDKQSIGR